MRRRVFDPWGRSKEHMPKAIGIDRDGCLDIEALIQDGSGRRKKVFLDPRKGT
jgi:hypothetical protein